jgi:hypothetical protein
MPYSLEQICSVSVLVARVLTALFLDQQLDATAAHPDANLYFAQLDRLEYAAAEQVFDNVHVQFPHGS